jgi:hypothetical protein
MQPQLFIPPTQVPGAYMGAYELPGTPPHQRSLSGRRVCLTRRPVCLPLHRERSLMRSLVPKRSCHQLAFERQSHSASDEPRFSRRCRTALNRRAMRFLLFLLSAALVACSEFANANGIISPKYEPQDVDEYPRHPVHDAFPAGVHISARKHTCARGPCSLSRHLRGGVAQPCIGNQLNSTTVFS